MPVTDTEPALEHLNSLREHVDGDIAEYVDTIAQLVLLEQDIDYPMLGAKVTLYLRPETNEWMVPESAAPPRDEAGWQYPFRSDGYENWSYDWYEEPDGQPT